jgi:hypothetical protein
VANGGKALVAASGVGGLEPLLERLSDDLLTDANGNGEQLVVVLRDSG